MELEDELEFANECAGGGGELVDSKVDSTLKASQCVIDQKPDIVQPSDNTNVTLCKKEQEELEAESVSSATAPHATDASDRLKLTDDSTNGCAHLKSTEDGKFVENDETDSAYPEEGSVENKKGTLTPLIFPCWLIIFELLMQSFATLRLSSSRLFLLAFS